MPCENCPNFDTLDACIQIFPEFPAETPVFDYSVEFLDISPNILDGTTTVRYRVCNCNVDVQGSGISHIDFEICPVGPGPDINIEATVDANFGVVDPEEDEPVEILIPGQEFEFAAVKIELDSVEAGECVDIRLVYNGIFTETDLADGSVGIKIGGGPFEIPSTANSATGLPLLVICEDPDFVCDNTCDDLCEGASDRVADLECAVTSPDSTCVTDIDPTATLLNFCVTVVGDITTGTCQSPAFIPTCNGELLECCVDVFFINFPAVDVEAVLSTNATFDGCEGSTPVPLTCVVDTTFENQTCFYCTEEERDAALDAIEECDLVQFSPATIVNGVLSVTATFTCPVAPAEAPETPDPAPAPVSQCPPSTPAKSASPKRRRRRR